MGNFLFQAATAMGYAWRHGLSFTLPDSTSNAKSNPIYLQHLVNREWNARLPEIKLQEKSHGFQELPFKREWEACNVILDGYWQSEKYFKEFRERVLTTMAFGWHFGKGYVSVHIRRGDYLTLTKKHPPVPTSWVLKQMEKFKGAQFKFFSDDIEWCKKTYGHRSDCSFAIFNSEVSDLVHMSCCEHHICSASTFAWWGAWLNQNPNKIVIFPKLWFCAGYRGLETKDILPVEWKRA